MSCSLVPFFQQRSSSSSRRIIHAPLREVRAFTLTEIMVAMAILAVVVLMAFVGMIAVLRGVAHTDAMVKGSSEIRHAADRISLAVRSAPRIPLVESSGCDLIVVPYNLGYAIVEGNTPIDAVNNVYGSKASQKMLKLSDLTPSAVASSIFAASARPTGAVSAGQISTYFNNASALSTIDLNDLFEVNDIITIPATAYSTTFVNRTINSISNNSGNKTITVTAKLGVDVPNGTKIFPSKGARTLFRVTPSGELRYFPDNRKMGTFTTLATDINPAPLSNPGDATSSPTVPFALVGNLLTINLQKVPRGTQAGRTLQGVQTSVYVRTDPLTP